MPTVAEKYTAYINSAEWFQKRNAALERAGHQCQLCRSSVKLNAHHNTYERLGAELDTDIIILCGKCHDVFHAKRDKRTAKKYGDEPRVKKWKNKKYSALPVNPASTDPVLQRVWRSKDSSGLMIRVEVTKEYLEKLVGPTGGITYRGLSLIGESIPWVPGWNTRAIGNTLEVDTGDLEAELAKVKHKIATVKVYSRSVREDFTDDDITGVIDDRKAKSFNSVRKIAVRWDAPEYAIRKILNGEWRAGEIQPSEECKAWLRAANGMGDMSEAFG